MSYRAGIIGTGGIADSHIQACLSRGDVHIAAIADVRSERLAALQEQYGLDAALHTDYRRMLEQEKLDFAIVNLPHFLHLDAATRCATAGVSLLLEKPMAMSTRECDAIIEAASAGGITLMIGHVIHYYPETMIARELVRSGELGELLMVNDFRSSAYFTEDRPAWFLKKEQSGGGILMNLGAHSFDRILWITGRNVTGLNASIQMVHPRYQVEGHARVNLTLDGNIPVTMTVYGYDDYPRNGLELHFTKGVIEVRYGEGVTVHQNGASTRVDRQYEAPFLLQLNDFLAVLENGHENPIPGEYGKAVVSLIEQAYASAGLYRKP